ncbi:MAG: hypothetical protein M0C28_11600 [Candidatus Moduliflexus flocculans]|nr:hypothetical protein [Candidatus Moduliflexus flocculans]
MALALAACGGDDGAQGPRGAPGAPGAPGPAGPHGPRHRRRFSLTANTPAATFAALDLAAPVTSVTINPATATTSPGTVVNFRLTDPDHRRGDRRLWQPHAGIRRYGRQATRT